MSVAAAAFLLGRLLFGIYFVLAGWGHFRQADALAGYAANAGIPAPKLGVLGSGALMLAGGLSVILGFWVRLGAIALILFLLPAAFTMHKYWAFPDPGQRHAQQLNFQRNLALTGAALVLYYFAAAYPESWVYALRP
jgi:putative oxidoreductase